MKLKANAKSPLHQTVQAAATPGAPGPSLHFQRSPDFRQMFEVDLDRLEPRPDQPRRHFDEAELQALAASVAARGVLQPILVRKLAGADDRYEIVAGERRWRASRLAGRDRIRAVLVDGDPAEIALIENMQRVDLTPLEEARGIQALIDAHNYSQGQVAEILGRSRVRINETLRLLALPPDILACLTSDTGIPRTTLLQIARTDDPALQRRLWQQARDGAGEKAIRSARAPHTPGSAVAGGGGAPAGPAALGGFLTDLARVERRLPALAPLKQTLKPEQRERIRALRDRLDELLGE